MKDGIAIVSAACRYPDASSPVELWDNSLAGRRSFRAIPKSRLDLARYAEHLVGIADSITPIQAGLLANWSFDRGRFRIPKRTFESTDLVHWLALELATEALTAIGSAEVLNRQRTAVVVANTLTGEFSRSSLLRMRGPFLDDLLRSVVKDIDVQAETGDLIRSKFSSALRDRLPEPTEESLAGGLANTIAGRIANYFDFGGGAYSVDGACASSLVALADAANLIVTEQADTVVVGAVDLSLDPFELVGFSRNGALAKGQMRVFDARSSGFWPGEGGAVVVLMKEALARQLDLRVEGRLRGWGISSDGAGGLTRPSSAGQLQAYSRAYERAGVDPADLAFVEAHGTGTAVGDPTEVRALAELRAGASKALPVGSIKANIGHTKAAAGFAGLLRAMSSLNHRMVAPHVGCFEPHPVFRETGGAVRPALLPESISGASAALAGVSSFGFGGVNTHVVLEGSPRHSPSVAIRRPVVPQDVEIFLLSAADAAAMERQLDVLDRRAVLLSRTELSDFAASVSMQAGRFPLRIALVARSGEELLQKSQRSRQAVILGQTLLDHDDGVFVGLALVPRRIGFLFPGQAAPARSDGGIWPRRFADSGRLLGRAGLSSSEACIDTAAAQPAIVAASMSGEALMRRLGVNAVVGLGHSLGEISALAWSGVLSQEAAIDLARARGEIMGEHARPGGAMLRLRGSSDRVSQLIRNTACELACVNGPAECVIAGPGSEIAALEEKSVRFGLEATRLSVSHAFHSADMEPAVDGFEKHLASLTWHRPHSKLYSTITGEASDSSSMAGLLVRQLTAPVLFDAALNAASKEADLFIEVGPGHALTRLAREKGLAAYSLDAHGYSLEPLMCAAAAIFVAGHDIDPLPLAGVAIRGDIGPASAKTLLTNPCGTADSDIAEGALPSATSTDSEGAQDRLDTCGEVLAGSSLDIVLGALSDEIGLPTGAIGHDDRFLDDLHLNSLAVSRVVTAAARASLTRLPRGPTDFANATPRELAAALDEIRSLGVGEDGLSDRITGVRPWVRNYCMRWTVCTAVPHSRRAIHEETDAHMRAIVEMPKDLTLEDAARLLSEVQVAAAAGTRHLAIVHPGAPLSSFARSVFYENCFQSVTVVERAADADLEQVSTLVKSAIDGYREFQIRSADDVRVPEFVQVEPLCSPVQEIGSMDVVLATGGARGIGAECALRLGQKGATLVLLGRSAATELAVRSTLDRARALGVVCYYASADVADPVAVRAALEPILSHVGPPSVLLHAAGVNEPARLADLDRDALDRAMRPKGVALGSLLALFGAGLRRVIAFGSIIGRIGLEGEAHYALANAVQSELVENICRSYPACTPLTIDWSVWGGIGMGERLGTVDRLEEKGVDALSVEDALDAFDQLVESGASGSVAVTGRFGPPPFLALGEGVGSTHRFVDDVKLFYPGVEVVADSRIHRGRDRYLDDHTIDGVAIMPGVMLIEAMAQIAAVLSPGARLAAAHDVHFYQAVSVPADEPLTVRVSALRHCNGRIEAMLTSAADDFSKPLARATFTSDLEPTESWEVSGRLSDRIEAAPIYRDLLFQGPSFQRISHWELLTSREVVARLDTSRGSDWFGPFDEPRTLFLDPGIGDAALHSVQPTIPHRRAVPVHIARVSLSARHRDAAVIRARELSASENRYVFDIVLEDGSGVPVQEWRGVTFASLDEIDCEIALKKSEALAVPYLERLVRESLDDSLKVALVRQPQVSSDDRKHLCISRLNVGAAVISGPDGRPQRIDSSNAPSFSHWRHMTLAMSANGCIGCDIEGAAAGAAFVGAEVIRKLGRRASSASLKRFQSDRLVNRGDTRTLIVHLPTPDGDAIVGVGMRTPKPQLNWQV